MPLLYVAKRVLLYRLFDLGIALFRGFLWYDALFNPNDNKKTIYASIAIFNALFNYYDAHLYFLCAEVLHQHRSIFMIKSFLAMLLLGGVLSVLILFANIEEKNVYVVHGNAEKQPLEIVFEKYFCSQDRVPIKELFNTAQAVRANGDTYFFNDVGSFLLWLNRQEDKDELVTWVYAQDTERYVPAKGAWYSRVEITPMGYGFGAYEYHIYGTADYYFNEAERFALRGETLWHPMVRSLLIENKL